MTFSKNLVLFTQFSTRHFFLQKNKVPTYDYVCNVILSDISAIEYDNIRCVCTM